MKPLSDVKVALAEHETS